jgi:endonuclease-3 related protein
MIRESLTEIYDCLLARFGPQHWWPGETRFEIITGAVLTQNTNWANVEKAIANLKGASLLEPEKLYTIEMSRLAELIRPAGYFNVKAKRLKNLLNWLFDNYGGKLENVEAAATGRLREELLSVSGIGPETADSILLYAFDRPVFVVDAYTARIAARHNLIEPPFEYEQLQQVFASNLDEDVRLFNEYHALLVRCGKDFCKPKARCAGCPLEKLPHSLKTESY